MDKISYLNNSDPATIENLYKQYQSDPESVDLSWRKFFEGFDFALSAYPEKASGKQLYPDEFKVINLINDYRRRGHLFTKTNPVRTRRKYSPGLNIENYGLTEKDLNREFQAGEEIGIEKAALSDIIDHLQQTYCQSVGAEFFYIRKPEVNQWLREKMESSKNTYPFTLEDKKYIFRNLSRAVLFEKFIHKRFPGQKRFSLEGAEALIPAMDAILEKGAELGNKECIIGMAHRGRLNVLANILRKPYHKIFSEFEGAEYEKEHILGDVKYHLGWTSERTTTKGETVKLMLTPNPSHLEAVNPVVEGIVRGKIDREYKGDYSKIAPILIHGDASIAAQGVVYEVVQMSGLEGYKTGGTIHLVINNQIGFTTNYLDGRTSTYCTDVAKVIQSPVFHVNGDDVEALVYTIQLAMEYRAKFQKDVFIDLLCYRKYGHNEGDEPRFTQPVLYKAIEKHKNPQEIYKEKLLEQDIIPLNEITKIEDGINQSLEKNLDKAKKIKKAHIDSFIEEKWEDIKRAEDIDFNASPETGVEIQFLLETGKNIAHLPPEKRFFRKTLNLQKSRLKMLEGTGNIDWGMAEMLAYGTLLSEGIPVRLSGQDTARGTFSHRHALLRVEDSEEEYIPLENVSDKQAKFEVYNSLLSEYGVLGFEYGYSLVSPDSLTVWEAQFGDFNNGGQIIIDQFLSSAEEKWNVMNDLVMYLPHGYEGQGPEHSSARLERFLILAAENNMQIVNLTTPANFFHVLRRQLYRKFRKPLIVFTPKSLLRHPKCKSELKEFTEARFQEVIDDRIDNENVNKLVFCSGKIYYELIEEREKINNKSIAFVRIEQLYPFPEKQVFEIIEKYSGAKTVLWVQEEPVNMGAWPFIRNILKEKSIKVIGRPPSGSPATGSIKFHALRQRKIIDKTFEICHCPLVGEECQTVCVGNRWRSFENELKKRKTDIKSTSVSAEKQLK